MVAVDRTGNPIEDLASTDLQVLDGGKAQQIELFRHIDTRPRKLTPLTVGEFSNRGGGSVEPVTLILFDLLNEHMDARGPAWHELIHALQPLESSDGLYLYLLTVDGRLYAVHSLPDSEKETRPADAAPWTRQIKPLLDEAMKAVFRTRPVEIDVDVRVRLTYASLGSLATRLASIPGRKNIVWITHGVPISLSPAYTGLDLIDYTPYLRQLSDRLDRANVSIYPVQQIPPGMAMPASPEARYSGLGAADTLQEFARYTGGRANAGNDIRSAILQAMNDARTSYQIGYRPTLQNWDGKFHKVKVTCARRGLRIQTKEGYYAWPEPPFDEEHRRELMEAAAAAPIDAAEIGLRATLSQDHRNAHTLNLQVRIDPADVVLLREGKQYAGQLRISVAWFNSDGSTGVSPVVILNLRYTTEQHDEIMKNGVKFGDSLNPKEGARKLRLVVLDATANAMGSVTMPVSGFAQPSSQPHAE